MHGYPEFLGIIQFGLLLWSIKTSGDWIIGQLGWE